MTPAQTAEKLVPYAMEKWGKKVYIIAADYNYGQITSQWLKKYVLQNGGVVASFDFFPLDVTNFGPTISKIQAAKPDILWSVLVGGAHIPFYRQWAAAGMRARIPMAASNFGVGNEHIVLSPMNATAFWFATIIFRISRRPSTKPSWPASTNASAPIILTSQSLR
ncbi:transporter substrate-binding protein [Paraburkholderia kirstenboschensis]|uniref:Transporter substrate-binding protein n=1 Tax=Paraburkholderia kirstenboschensis TaxID=1245436 RepID=A0ABZ0EAT2_9BURK|nr:ABC transporter substrate-binding protein [Paraburkholderia kirstenboschensis]WOD13584.1 transporter substrate-binding protein [Paraburkholderia kirstenboschensis]